MNLDIFTYRVTVKGLWTCSYASEVRNISQIDTVAEGAPIFCIPLMDESMSKSELRHFTYRVNVKGLGTRSLCLRSKKYRTN